VLSRSGALLGLVGLLHRACLSGRWNRHASAAGKTHERLASASLGSCTRTAWFACAADSSGGRLGGSNAREHGSNRRSGRCANATPGWCAGATPLPSAAPQPARCETRCRRRIAAATLARPLRPDARFRPDSPAPGWYPTGNAVRPHWMVETAC
jgi:hypothetical protein